MADDKTNYQTQYGATKALGQEYDLWAAGHSSDVAPWAKLGAMKTGGGENVIRDLVMLLQSLAGIENGGVALSQNLRAGVMRGGISGITPEGNTGMINGFDVVSAQASNALHQTMMRNFTNPVTGLANRHAKGLDQAELGRLAGYMLGQGQGMANGPLLQSETMTEDRIKDLRKTAADMRPGSERDKLLRELETTKVGQTRLTETANMGKFTKMMEDGAETLQSIKDVFGSPALKDLDDTFQQLLGGTLTEVGPRAARARMMGIKAMGTTFFGGDMQAAGTYSLGNQIGLAQTLGARFGIDPATASELFRQIAGTVAHEMDLGGVTGQRTQGVNASAASKFGIGMKTAGAAEITELNHKDFSALLSEDPAAIALSHLMQTTEGSRTPEEKKAAQRAFDQWSNARTEKERNDASALLESTFASLSGNETYGHYLARNGGTAEVLGNVVGDNARRLGKSTYKLLQGVREEKLKGIYATSENYGQLRKDLNLDSNGMGEFGLTTGSLTVKDWTGVMVAMEEKDPARRKGMLEKLGLNKGYEQQLNTLAGKEGGAKQLMQVRANATQGEGMKGFQSVAQMEESAVEEYGQIVKANQYSDANHIEDFGSGLIRGLYGGRLATGRDVIESAGKLGLSPAKLSLKDNLIESNDANAEALMRHLGPERSAKLGLQDKEAVKEYLKSAQNQRELIDEFGTYGAFEFKDNTLQLLDEKATENGKRLLEDSAKNNLLKQTGMVDAKYKSVEYVKKDGETDADFEKRKAAGIEDEEKKFKTMLHAQINKASATSYNKDSGSWSKLDDILNKVTAGDKEAEATYNAWLGGGALDTHSNRTAISESIKSVEDALNLDKKKGAAGMNMNDDEYTRYIDGREAKLNELKDSLHSKDASIIASNVTMTVNGDVSAIMGKPKE